MGTATVTGTDVLSLIFQAVAWANIADDASTSPTTIIAWALHTADPTASGTQATNEIAYTSYARVSVVRTSSGHAVSSASMSPVSNVSFPAGTGGSGTATHASVGKTASGSTDIFFSGTITPNISTGSGITPILDTSSTLTLT